MECATKTGTRTSRGWVIYLLGWAIFALSAVLGLSSKTSAPHSDGPFWFTLSTMVGVSLVYCIGFIASPRWRSRNMRGHFSPFLLGSAGWLVLILILWLSQ